MLVTTSPVTRPSQAFSAHTIQRTTKLLRNPMSRLLILGKDPSNIDRLNPDSMFSVQRKATTWTPKVCTAMAQSLSKCPKGYYVTYFRGPGSTNMVRRRSVLHVSDPSWVLMPGLVAAVSLRIPFALPAKSISYIFKLCIFVHPEAHIYGNT